MKWWLLMLCACASSKPGTEIEGEVVADLDGDGFYSDEDCDDSDSMVNPSAEEICDGFDNNCNGLADEDVKITFYVDSDGDGFGDPDITADACENPSGFVDNGSDCDDNSATTSVTQQH